MTQHLQALQKIFGEAHVYHTPIDCFGYSYDASPEPLDPAHTPAFVCKAHHTEEVAACLRYANWHRIPVVARGTGSGRSGGSIPLQGGIVLSLDEMNQILDLDEKNMMVTVEAGVQTKTLHDFCAAHQLFYPPDPSSYVYSTIGGNIAENAGGIKAVKYGVTSNYVMGLEVVLADGTVVQTGGKMMKNVTGYNLTQLFVGSEGTLGIITKATLRLLHLPKTVQTATATFSTVEDACTAVAESLRQGIVPTAAELLDRLSCQAAATFNDFSLGEDVGALVVFDVDGIDEDTCAKEMAQLKVVCEKAHAIDFTIAQTKAEADKLWDLRRKLSSAVAALAPNKVGEDISVPRAQLPIIVKAISAIAEKHHFTLSIYGHAGDGNLHPAFLCDLKAPGVYERLQEAIAEVFQATVAVGGTLSGEHGIGISKQPFIDIALSEEVIQTSLLIKKALDPHDILNPRKIFNR